MSALDVLIPTPRLLEVDEANVAAAPARVWDELRHGDLGRAPVIRALFWLRTLPERVSVGTEGSAQLRIDHLVSTPQQPGFQVLTDDPPHEVVVGAIGKVWRPIIPFVHVADAEAFSTFCEPDYVKVAWALRVHACGGDASRVEIEVRVDATDEAAWQQFVPYFRIIGPASRFIRRMLLADLVRTHAAQEVDIEARSLDGDDLLPDAAGQMTHTITIEAPPSAVWPWLVQMGCGRGGFYSIDVLDNGGQRSARELHPQWSQVRVGQVIAARPKSSDGFEVLRCEAPRGLVLGGLFDTEAGVQRPFAAARPHKYWQVTWAFVLEPVDGERTRLYVRARAAFSKHLALHAAYIRPVHHLMQSAQLRHLAARVEGRLSRDDYHDVLEGVGGAGLMTLAWLTPFLRARRSHWGLSPELAAREYPGDDRVPAPGWMWTHAVEINAPAERVWPWIAQIGADRGGFYSYQWLENVVGCDVHNAETVHPEWQVQLGGELRLHPKGPALHIVALEPGRHFVAEAPADEEARQRGGAWVAASWAFFVEPLSSRRCRLISRYRAACSSDFATRMSFGPMLMEPVGFAMDRRMLLGVKQRSEAEAGRAS